MQWYLDSDMYLKGADFLLYPQFDSSFVSPAPLFGQIHGASFRPNLPTSGAAFGFNAGNVHHSAAFPGDLNGITSVSDRPKKVTLLVFSLWVIRNTYYSVWLLFG